MLRATAVALLLLAAPCAAVDIDTAKLVDLTYPFGAETIYWPTAQGFKLEVVHHGDTPGHYWYEANNYSGAEHGGTHMDAPAHFSEGKLTADQVPIAAGIGPLVRVDVSAAAARDPDYRLTRDDLLAWERAHGRIPAGAIVVMYSGWGARWPDKLRYLGTDKAGDVANLHFPGFSREAAEFLVGERDIKAIGVDTPSIDYGPSQDFIVHRVVNGANKPGFENLANLDKLPAKGATLIALPMPIEGGSGGPLRAIAILP
ncbi:MAG: cyclase family protein [Deltaproteobacteria bacterium]|nr:cyclase family protein [Deltaproteobacteria bacterium]